MEQLTKNKTYPRVLFYFHAGSIAVVPEGPYLWLFRVHRRYYWMIQKATGSPIVDHRGLVERVGCEGERTVTSPCDMCSETTPPTCWELRSGQRKPHEQMEASCQTNVCFTWLFSTPSRTNAQMARNTSEFLLISTLVFTLRRQDLVSFEDQFYSVHLHSWEKKGTVVCPRVRYWDRQTTDQAFFVQLHDFGNFGKIV